VAAIVARSIIAAGTPSNAADAKGIGQMGIAFPPEDARLTIPPPSLGTIKN